jgi:hypothetical protein
VRLSITRTFSSLFNPTPLRLKSPEAAEALGALYSLESFPQPRPDD